MYMRLNKIFILGLGFILVSKLAYSYNWPFEKPNEQVLITGVLGEPRPKKSPFTHFHTGVDLAKSAGTPIYSVMNGWVCMKKAVGDPDDYIGIKSYISENEKYAYGHRYIHVKDHTESYLDMGMPVYTIGNPDCKSIGKIKKVEKMDEHLHFEEVGYEIKESGEAKDVVNWLNPLFIGGLGAKNNSEYGFKDTAKPKIDSIKFYKNMSNKKIDADNLYLDVDIAVGAHDDRINADGSAGGEGIGLRRISCGVYKCYEDKLKEKYTPVQYIPEDDVVNAMDPDALIYATDLIFDSIYHHTDKNITQKKLELTYHNDSTWAKPIYWLTNMPMIEQSLPGTDTCWNTKDIQWLTGEDPRYPLVLKIEVEDFRGNTQTTYKKIKVDNHAPHLDITEVYQKTSIFDMKKEKELPVKSPYLERVEKEKTPISKDIKELYKQAQEELQGYNNKYCAYWEENFEHTGRELKILTQKSLLRGVETKFVLHFSQSVKIDLAYISCPDNTNKRITLNLNRRDEYWNNYISDPVIIPSSEDWDGEVLLSVWARDTNWNDLDGDPRTIAVRDQYGFHEGYEWGGDVNHRFKTPKAPAAPSNLTAIVKRRGDNKWVELYWQDNSDDEDWFEVYRRKDGETEWWCSSGPGSNTTSITDVPPEDGTYYYIIKAYKRDSGYSSPTPEQIAVFIPGEESDWILPGGKIIYDSDNFYTRGSITIKAKVWDNVGVKKVEFYYSSCTGEERFIGESSNFYRESDGTYTIFEWNSSKLSESGWGIFCYIRDYAGNRGLSENIWNIGIDNIPPPGISNLTVYPETWSGINFFSFGWDAAQDFESYVEGYYCSLNSPPTEKSSFTLTTCTELSLPPDATSGVYPIYVMPRTPLGI